MNWFFIMYLWDSMAIILGTELKKKNQKTNFWAKVMKDISIKPEYFVLHVKSSFIFFINQLKI